MSPAALQLVNNFLDQLLFNFLTVSRSTTLSALRPAVSDVLKPKLAKDAINQADEELREYLGGDDEESTQSQSRDPGSPTDWDLELAWKRTRLRCMVYSSLGDMEEEDEDYYMEQGHLDSGFEDRSSEAVSPAVAIFLTSILEFLGEQALVVAGQAAYHRMRIKYEKDLKEGARSPTGVAEKVLIEELDMERVALDRTLGRLWRGWKKKIRSPGIGSMDRLTRSYSGDSMRAAYGGHMRSPSSAAEFGVPATVPEPDAETENVDDAAQAHDEESLDPLEEYLIAVGIPLPLGPNDVAEIEVPGLAPCSDDEAEDEDLEQKSKRARPKSFMVFRQLAPTEPQPHAQGLASRKRSNSVPARVSRRYVSPAQPQPKPSAEDLDGDLPTTGPERIGILPGKAGESGREPGEADVASPATGVEEDGAKEDEDEDEDDEVSIEEPRIVRSSRVSIIGRSSSPTSSDHGKPIPINTNLPVRTPSIHSARLIDVTSPRSPGASSRRNSVAVSIRHSSPSHTSRTGTPSVPDDQLGQTPENVPSNKPAINKSGPGTGLSVSEAANNEYTVSPITPGTPTSRHGSKPAAIPEPQPKQQYEPSVNATGSSLRSDGSGAREPSTPTKALTKVTILPATSSPSSIASTTSGTFFIESMPVLPEGVEIQDHHPRVDSHRYRSPAAPQAPAVPERSAGRQAVANTSAYRQPATIGQVSVERSRNRSPDEPSSSRVPEPAPAPTRQQHSSGSPSSTKLKPVRTSEEGMHARIDVVRDFEELIQSDQTIQYTLTPENMRDIDVSPIPPFLFFRLTPEYWWPRSNVEPSHSLSQHGRSVLVVRWWSRPVKARKPARTAPVPVRHLLLGQTTPKHQLHCPAPLDLVQIPPWMLTTSTKTSPPALASMAGLSLDLFPRCRPRTVAPTGLRQGKQDCLVNPWPNSPSSSAQRAPVAVAPLRSMLPYEPHET